MPDKWDTIAEKLREVAEMIASPDVGKELYHLIGVRLEVSEDGQRLVTSLYDSTPEERAAAEVAADAMRRGEHFASEPAYIGELLDDLEKASEATANMQGFIDRLSPESLTQAGHAKCHKISDDREAARQAIVKAWHARTQNVQPVAENVQTGGPTPKKTCGSCAHTEVKHCDEPCKSCCDDPNPEYTNWTSRGVATKPLHLGKLLDVVAKSSIGEILTTDPDVAEAAAKRVAAARADIFRLFASQVPLDVPGPTGEDVAVEPEAPGTRYFVWGPEVAGAVLSVFPEGSEGVYFGRDDGHFEPADASIKTCIGYPFCGETDLAGAEAALHCMPLSLAELRRLACVASPEEDHPQRPEVHSVGPLTGVYVDCRIVIDEPAREPGDVWCERWPREGMQSGDEACKTMLGLRAPGQDPKVRGVPKIIKKCRDCGEIQVEPEAEDGLVTIECTAEQTDAEVVDVPAEPEPIMLNQPLAGIGRHPAVAADPDTLGLPPLSDDMLGLVEAAFYVSREEHNTRMYTPEEAKLERAIRRLEANQLDPEATCGDCDGCCRLPSGLGLVVCSRRQNVNILTTTTACAKIKRKGQSDATD